MNALSEDATVYLKNIKVLEIARDDLHKCLDGMRASIGTRLVDAWKKSDPPPGFEKLIVQTKNPDKGKPRLAAGWRKRDFRLFFEDPRRDDTSPGSTAACYLVLRISGVLEKHLSEAQKKDIAEIGKRHRYTYAWSARGRSKEIHRKKFEMDPEDPKQTVNAVVEEAQRHLECVAELEREVVRKCGFKPPSARED